LCKKRSPCYIIPMGKKYPHTINTYPHSRVATFDVGVMGRKKHHMAGLLEVDVTLSRKVIRDKIREGSHVSFNAWFIKVLADSLAEEPAVHGVNIPRFRQISFKEVDISLPLEKIVDGKPVPLPLILRNVSEISIEEIQDTIDSALNSHIIGAEDYTLNKRSDDPLAGLFFHSPGFIRRIIWKILLRNPFSLKRNMGTVMVTTTGIPSSAPGWILPKSMHNLALALGPISKKPWVLKGQIVPRDILNLTILFDHDVIDGAPAARFVQKLTKRLQSAYGLDRR
jgi:hypothetical protein